MRSNTLTLLALSAFGLLASASRIHLDVSSTGHVEVDVDTEVREQTSTRKAARIANPTYDKPKAHVLAENQVDLDYEVHQGFESKNGKYIEFKNIPYAEPPVGENRFLPPIYVQNHTDKVNDGSVEHICPQMQVGWVPEAFDFLQNFTKLVLPGKFKNPITPDDYADMPPFDADKRVSEDCLTLDVMVPKEVWAKRNDRAVFKRKFIYGWKSQYGSPEGLFTATNASEEEQGVIYVAMNYRLGAFGFLGGEKFYNDGGTANNGLLDQAFALNWVQEHIWKFGGDSRRVTAMGQSAGASSIMHHITAYGGYRGKPPIQGAILQSPGFFPQPNVTQDDLIYSEFLKLTGAKSLEELQSDKFDTKILQNASAIMTYKSNYGYFNFGPTVDGDYVPKLPGILLKEKNFHEGIALMLGDNMYDGLLFTPPWIRDNAALRAHAQKLYPGIPGAALDKIDEKYPIRKGIAQFQILDVSDFLDDISIQCNNYYLTQAALASSSSTYHPVYRYSFNALPAVHGYDTGYTYFPSKPLIEPVNETLAKFLQKAIVDFVRYKDANPENVETWQPISADSKKVMHLGDPGQSTKPDYTVSFGDSKLDASKCDYWQSAPYYAPKGKKSVEFVVQGGNRKEGL